MRKGKTKWLPDVNVVAFMAQRLGGITAASRKLGISPNTLRKYLAAGNMAKADFETVVRASNLSGLSIEELTGLRARKG